MSLSIALSPEGHLYVDHHNESVDPANTSEQEVLDWFAISPAIALLRLAVSKVVLKSPTLIYWQRFGQGFIDNKHKQIASGSLDTLLVSYDPNEWSEFLLSAPPMLGGEYLSNEVLQSLWDQLNIALSLELIPFNNQFFDYVSKYHPDWQKIGRVCFHLAENKNNLTHPFAFMATYTIGFSTIKSTTQHIPLGQALKEYAGDQNKSQLLNLLTPVQNAAQTIPWVKEYVGSGQIFHPQRWTAKQAYPFLTSVAQLEASGLVVRVPNWWQPKHPPRPKITIAVGNKASSLVGMNALLDFEISYALPDGEHLTQEEIQLILNAQESLVPIRGQWIEVDAEKIAGVVSHWKSVEKQVKRDGLTFAEGLRFLAGASSNAALTPMVEDVVRWSKVEEGAWLKEMLQNLRHPDNLQNEIFEKVLSKHLNATLRPYQTKGVQWLWLLYQLGLGGCLADDMGLGKTIQVIALLLLIKHKKECTEPHLLVVPASLLGNWQREIQNFAPSLKLFTAHASSGTELNFPDFKNIDLVMTTYGNVYRLPRVAEQQWHTIILDEAQSIKNPSTKQTLAIKSLKGSIRFLLTGTPVENRLLDLWSLFDFCAPGLLGGSKEFSKYGKKIVGAEESERAFYAVVRKLVNPYILRRLKSDKSIIQDLPDKTECDSLCFLSKQQISLYQQSVVELEKRLNDDEIEPMARRGLILSYLMRFKQICNHPSQWLGHGEYDEKESGKFIQLRALCEIIAEKQEKVLIFTQYKEIIPHLHDFLATVFERPGLVLHGQTPIKERQSLVESFQKHDGPPFFVLSLKAGGTGLTLTRASHVIHFDRWWNPAVENQATDRAYRIGQKKNVVVHKFICQGTLEEKINDMISSKKELASDILGADAQTSLTEFNNDDLIKMISLDIHKAIDNP